MRCKLITERGGRWSPRKSGSLGLAITICAATLLTSGCGGVARAGTITLQPICDGLKPEWSPDGQKIAFHRKGADGYYDAYIMNPDGSSESCLTHDKQELPGRNAGCASWHPSGNYLIFTAEKAQHAGGSELSHPGIGFNCDIWLMTSDGQYFWRLTDLITKMNPSDSTPVTGVLGPRFSHDGTRVSWSERIGPGGNWGEWAIRLADFVWNSDGVPSLENIKTYQPGDQHRYYESNDFSPDDSKLLFCGNLISGQDETEMDIYTLGLNDGKLVRLTEGGKDWNETGHFSPDGRNVVWLSNRGYAIDSSSKGSFWWESQKTDFWTMNADGSGKKQLTFYNSPGSADYESVGGMRTMSEYASWNPDGKRLAGGLIIDDNGITLERIVLIDAPVTEPTWFLAEGSTAWGYSCYITIENPNDTAVNARVTYQTNSGPVTGRTVWMPARSQATVNPRDTVGVGDFSTQVDCVEGKPIAVDRTMTWNRDNQGEEGHCSVGVTSAAITWYLPEGSSSWGFECWLLIQNPGSSTAHCTVTYMIEGEGPRSFNKTVDAGTRATFNMADDIGSKDTSIKVESDVPVITERAMYRNNRREGHDSIGTNAPAADYYLAEGATGYNVGYLTYVLVQNPQASATDVNITYQTGSGQVAGPSFNIPANSRKTVRVNDSLPPNSDVSTHVHGSAPIIAERAMYWNNGSGEACHDSIGMASPHSTFYLPDGETVSGRETWTLVQNPNDSDVQVDITYMTDSGAGNVTKTETIPASSRKTFNMTEHSGINGRASIMVVSKGSPVMVERAMYWNSRGAGTDTTGGFSD